MEAIVFMPPGWVQTNPQAECRSVGKVGDAWNMTPIVYAVSREPPPFLQLFSHDFVITSVLLYAGRHPRAWPLGTGGLMAAAFAQAPMVVSRFKFGRGRRRSMLIC